MNDVASYKFIDSTFFVSYSPPPSPHPYKYVLYTYITQSHNQHHSNKMSNIKKPLEHKWIVRILLQKLEVGIGSESMLSYYHPWATDIYSANKNIRTLCATLCDPEFVRRKKEQLQREVDAVENHNRTHHLPQSHEPATLNSTIAPMLSMRTSFESFLSDIRKRHQAYTNALDKDDPIRRSLALKFPSFVSEIKLDGERILAHVKRGVVTMQVKSF